VRVVRSELYTAFKIKDKLPVKVNPDPGNISD
jgi:hypothetical protein